MSTLRELETITLNSYKDWLADVDSQSTKTELFKCLMMFSERVLIGQAKLRKRFKVEDTEIQRISYEYALYLWDRIVIGGFRLDPTKGKNYEQHMLEGKETRFPLYNYISQNLRNTLYNFKVKDNWYYIIDDLSFLEKNSVDKTNYLTEENSSSKYLNNKTDVKQVLEAMRLFFDMDEINRMLPAAIKVVSSKKQLSEHKLPKDLKNFCIHLLAIIRRIASPATDLERYLDPKSYGKSLESSIKSCIFLSTISNSDFFPKELLLTLDLKSLFRLVNVAGGTKVEVPTIMDLNKLILANRTISNMLLTGEDEQTSHKNTKKELDMTLPQGSTYRRYLHKLVTTLNIFDEDNENSLPLIRLLDLAISNTDKIFESMLNNETSTPKDIVEQYKVVSDSCNKISNAMNTILKYKEALNENSKDNSGE